MENLARVFSYGAGIDMVEREKIFGGVVCIIGVP